MVPEWEGKLKNEYIIVKHVDEQEAKERGCAATLYYCGAGWHFSAMRHNAEVFTNKRKKRLRGDTLLLRRRLAFFRNAAQCRGIYKQEKGG